jgi:hypothetical protein
VGPSVAVVSLVVGAAGPACKGTPTEGFQIEVPANVSSQVAWYEVGVFSGAECSSLAPQLAGGVPADGYLERLAFQASNASPPGISNLPRATYSIGVAARAADCTVLASGCSNVDLRSASSVAVILNDVPTPAGACTGGTTCEDAECVAGAGDVGNGCSLEFVGAGPLADPLSPVGTVMSAPALAATPSGFLVAYREYDPVEGAARITVLPVDNGGGEGTPQTIPQMACAASQTSDATAMFFTTSGGSVAAARAGCGNDSGIDFISVSATGALGTGSFADLGSNRVYLSTAHAMSSAGSGTFLAFTQGSQASVASIDGVSLSQPASFGGNGRMSQAWVAASDDAVALLAQGTPNGEARPLPQATDDGGSDDSGPPPPEDAGEDSGTSSSEDSGLPPVEDSGSSSGDDGGTVSPLSTLRFNLIGAGDAGGSPIVAGAAIGGAIQFPGTWGSVAVLEGRAFVASDGQSTDQPVVFRAFDLGNNAPSVMSGFNPQGIGPVLYADVAAIQDRLFFAVERPGVITLDAFENATTSPTFLREVLLGNDARIPTTEDVRDGRVAVLATSTRVIVAWTTQEVLGQNDATGGYAVFACTTP